MSNRVFSPRARRVSLTISLALALLWSLGGVFITANAVQAQPIDLIRPSNPTTTGPTVVATVTVGSGPFGVGVNPNTNRSYVANFRSSNVSAIDGTGNTVVATVTVGSYPYHVGINPTTNRIYVSHYTGSNSVSVIDGANNTVSATVTVGNSPFGVGVNPITNRIYVSNYGADNISVIDGADNTVAATITVGPGPTGIGINPTTDRIYVANYFSNNVSVIDGASNTVVATVTVGSHPVDVGIDPTTNRIYVANSSSSNVAVIDGANNTVVATVTVGTNPKGVGVNPTTNRIYVANSGSNNVSVIDGTNNTVVVTVPIGSYPTSVGVNPNTNRAYVTNYDDDNVSVIQDGGAWYVAPPPLGNDANDCLSPATPCATIAATIGKAAADDTIHIAAGTYNENVTVAIPLNFIGAGASNTIVDGNHIDRVFNIVSGTVSIAALTVQHGLTSGGGGGIYAASALTLTNVNILSNTATNGGGGLSVLGNLMLNNTHLISNTGGGVGGGALAQGPAEISSSRFIDNHTSGPNFGGGGLFAEGKLAITDTEFTGNTSYGGGGLMGGAGPVRIVRSHFERNDGAYGGGLAVFESDLILIDTDLISNTARAGSGAFVGGPNLTLVGGRFEGNNCPYGSNECSLSYGGGLTFSGTMTVTDTLFVNNSAGHQGGGIYFVGGRGRFVNTLFARNSATLGAAIYFEASESSDILHSTFVNQTSIDESAIAILSGTLNLTNTIIASHTIAISNTGGTVYEDYNLFYGNITNTVGVTNGGHSLIGNPLFVVPAHDDYHLKASSAAIDHGVEAGVTTDLDGNPRPIGAGFDIGAYEYLFVPSNYTLTLATVGNGAGTVSANPPGPSYTVGTVVTLTATPLMSSTFSGWNGNIVTTTPQITVTMDADKSITATFALKTFVITPTSGANGSITPSTPQTVNYGANQTFTITPNTGYHIVDVGVDGVSQGPLDLYAFTNITANHIITAAFALNLPNTYTLTVNTAGDGLGSVTLNPPGPTYTVGTIVTLTATPAITSTFTGWSGDVVTTTNPLTVTMTGNRTITATFALKPYLVYLPLIVR